MRKSTEHPSGTINDTRMTRAQRLALEKIAQSLAEVCVRNALENLHAGIFPSSQTGDYSDVTVVTPYGEIPWNQLARISDEEMKPLMIDIVNKDLLLSAFPGGAGRRVGSDPTMESPQARSGSDDRCASSPRFRPFRDYSRHTYIGPY
jgi:hypothetical protein